MSKITVELQRKPRKYNRSICIYGVDFITPDVMKAVEQECQSREGSEEDKDLKLDWSSMARAAKDVLENNLCPETGLKILGPFMISDAVFPEKGDSATLIKGSKFRSTHPDPEMEEGVLARKQTVTVSSVHGGFIDRDREVKVVDPTVNWAGTGGYWRWTSVVNIEGNRA